ncbi:hypothetical protein [Streptomyces xanthochromogenes]|uniref:Lipoprotein n=1 Tax=Streptomyces xanthochromogenes TaxID=67384 RepID=A0ABQ3A1M3_9ACTN|nr:hypothetical protein [Streptomyces xanthochromogenes]GGY30239.1 lipoprotein [Streptomyces xanthochromogenes]
MRRRTIATTTALFTCVAAMALTACSGSGSGSDSGSGPGASNGPSAARTPAAATPAAAKGPYADLTGGQIVTNSFRATRQAGSLHLKAKIADAKEGPSTMDLSMDHKGDCAGTMGQGKDTIRIIKTGKVMYLKTRDSGNKWVKTDTTSADSKELASSCDLNSFLDSFKGDDTDTEAKKGATTTVGGRTAIALTESDGAEHYTIDVATTGKPYLLKMVITGGDSPGTMEFSQFDQPIHAVAPPKSAVLTG